VTRDPVRKLLFVIPDLRYGGTARQLTLLAANLPPGRFEARVVSLGPEATWAQGLRAAGVAVESLDWRHAFDVRPLLGLRALARAFRPDIIHAWGPAALRAVASVPGSRGGGRLVVSAALRRDWRRARLDHLLLRRARRVIALGEAEARRYLAAGVRPERITRAPPAAPLVPAGEDPASPTLPVPPDAFVILGIGPLEMTKGFREGVWALDILRQVYDHPRLVLAGTGPDRPRIEEFARALRVAPWVHFTGAVADLCPWLRRADVVWVPSLADRGRGAALEAMAAGRPVVAARWPGLAEVVEEWVTGLLVPPADKAALARQTRLLLAEPELRRRLGEGGRQRAAKSFSPDALARACAEVYDS
jgi:glycosyltransferase involved in cell wall biosynthesis